MGRVIDIRRYMGGGGEKYHQFVDKEFGRITAYYRGDTKLVQGEIDSGTVTTNGSALVYSSWTFAHCTAIPKHTLSDGTTFNAVSAAAQNFTAVINLGSNDIFDSLSSEDIAITVSEIKDTNWSEQVLQSVTKEDVTNYLSNNIVTIPFTSSNGCRYIRIGMYGKADVESSWSILAQGNRQPVGITLEQIQTINLYNNASYYRSNVLITDFSDFQYFISTTNYTWQILGYVQPNVVKFPPTLVQISFYGSLNKNMQVIDFPATLTTGDSRFWLGFRYSTQQNVIIIFRNTTPPAFGTDYQGGWQNMVTHIYVPQESVQTYKEDSRYSYFADRIGAIEGSGYEIFNNW